MKQLCITIGIALLGWVLSAVWIVSEIRTEVRLLRADQARTEQSLKELNDKMFYYALGNKDVKAVWFDRTLEK